MRRTIGFLMIAGGLVLMVVSYFFLAAPWGASGVEFSNPRVPFAPLLFVIGVMALFAAGLIYELLPDRKKKE
ncbi:MAG: hypothetical protein ACE5KX_00235 [Acidimicrobiia bacterium]